MELTVRIGFVFALAVCHAPFAIGFLRSLHRRQIPEILNFAAVGIILYYDLGFILECFGWSFVSPFYAPLSTYGLERFSTVGLILLTAPYLLAIGFHLTAGRMEQLSADPTHGFDPRLKPIFWMVFVPVSLALGGVGYAALHGAASPAEVKLLWLGAMGGGYVAFLVPMFLLAFFLRTRDCLSRSGVLTVVLFLAASTSATLFLGQRTMTLLPFLMVVLFRPRVNALSLFLSFLGLFLFASGALVFYKGYAVRQDLNLTERMEMVLGNDLVRANVLARAVDESEPIGTKILPGPGRGYLYTALLYIPRSWLPQKGHSTAAYFTAFANGEDAEFVSWGLGIGFLEEIILNFGFLLLVPGVVVYGMGLGLLQRVCQAFESAAVGAHLSAIWICGYGLPSVVLYFGSMTIFAIVLENFFLHSADRGRVALPSLYAYSAGQASPGQIVP
ncbi:MAG: hypothetical protein LC114_16705 [Bryobacterales bacterium]|nr:hypothetical protein [Bryobacterales bacterium]